MAGFLYFLPGATEKPDSLELERLGLGHLATDPLAINQCKSGPPAGPGLTVAVDCDAMPAVGYWLDTQTWADCGKFWLGIVNDYPPRAADLLRRQITPGHEVVLADGESYQVPAVTFLPSKITLVGGNIIREPVAKFAKLKESISECWRDYRRDAGMEEPADKDQKRKWESERLSEAGQFELAVKGLAVNYRLSVAEVNEMGLFTDIILVKILEAMMDVPGLIQMIKKMNDAEGIGAAAAGGGRKKKQDAEG